MRERDVEKYLKHQIEKLGGVVRKLKWIGHRGAPDRMVILLGQVWFVELKATGKKAEPHQLREHARLRQAGAAVMVLDSIEVIDTVLAPYRNGPYAAVIPNGDNLTKLALRAYHETNNQ